MSIWAIVPIKPLNRAKSRLAAVLSAEQREYLALEMLRHNLRVLSEIPGLDGVLVISRDTKALAEARAFENVQTLQESGTPELNHALRRATQMLISWGTTATLILPADIPLLNRNDVENILRFGGMDSGIVIAPDRLEDGTNAIFTRPPDVIEFGFGRGSFVKHVQKAENAGANLHIYRSERLGLDVDSPDDLEKYAELARRFGESMIDFENVTSSE